MSITILELVIFSVVASASCLIGTLVGHYLFDFTRIGPLRQRLSQMNREISVLTKQGGENKDLWAEIQDLWKEKDDQPSRPD